MGKAREAVDAAAHLTRAAAQLVQGLDLRDEATLARAKAMARAVKHVRDDVELRFGVTIEKDGRVGPDRRATSGP